MDRTEETSRPARRGFIGGDRDAARRVPSLATMIPPLPFLATVLLSLAFVACGGRGGSSTSSYVAPPVLASLSPTSGSTGGGEPIELTGTSFDVGTSPVVTFGNTPALVADASTATSIRVITPALVADASTATSIRVLTPVHGEGVVDVTVTNSDGLASTLVNGFTYESPAGNAPRVTSLSVNRSPPAGGGLLVVKGLNFQASSTVTFGGTPATVTDFEPGVPPGGDVLTVVVPPSPLLPDVTDGFVSVVLRNPDGQSSTLAPSVSPDGTPWPANFHYGLPPVVTGFSPSIGKGLDVTLTGTGFSSDATGARVGLEVLMSGPSFATLQIRKCPNAADPACLPGVVSPTPTSLVVTIPSNQLPGNYGFVLTDFDGQSAMAPGVFVVP